MRRAAHLPWELLELSRSLDGPDVPHGLIDPAGPQLELIVFGHREVMSPADLGFNTSTDVAPEQAAECSLPARLHFEAPEVDMSDEVFAAEASVAEDADVAESGEAPHESIQEDVAGEVVMQEALADELSVDLPESITIDDVVLTATSTLSTLRAACQSLGVGKSGSRATVFSRLVNRLKSIKLAEAARARNNLEAHAVAVPKQPEEPTPEQRRSHEATHCPYASWCEHCIAFRGRDDSHSALAKSSEDRMPCISFDYGFTSRVEGGPKLVALYVHDSQTGWRECFPVPAKGGTHSGTQVIPYLASELCRLLAFLGYSQVTLKSDPEPTCIALQAEVRKLRLSMGLRTVCQQVPEGSHQSNGGAEMCVHTVRQLAGSLLACYESKAKQKVKSLDPIHSWAMRHAAFILNRFQVQSGGLTAFEAAMGRPYRGALIPYGETVMMLVPQAGQGAKGKPRFIQCQMLGKVMVSDQWIGVSSAGRLVLARTARRMSPEFPPQDHTVLKDHPWNHPGFIAGSAGRMRAQRQPKVVLPSGLSPLLASGDGGGLKAGGVDLIETGQPVVPGDVSPSFSLPYSPSIAPEQSPNTVAASDPSSSSDSESAKEAPAAAEASQPVPAALPMDESMPLVHEHPEAEGNDDRSKRARIAALQFEHGEEDPVEFDVEQCEHMYDHDLDVDDREEDAEPKASIPLELYYPFSPEEPQLSREELEHLDSVADQHEITRLLGMNVLEDNASCKLGGGSKVLSTRFVRTWRVKPHPVTGEPSYLRRSRLVAREFARDDQSRTGLYSPASQQLLTRLLPALWSSRPGHIMMSLDVTDAYLCVSQTTDVWVSLYGQSYQLRRLLPGQREGSARWYEVFAAALTEAGATAWDACPALFRLRDNQGAALTHVDDLLGEGEHEALRRLTDFLCTKFKCSVQFLVKTGDSISFLKREHCLTADNTLVIRSHPKHLERLMEITGVKHGHSGKNTPMPLQVPDLGESPS